MMMIIIHREPLLPMCRLETEMSGKPVRVKQVTQIKLLGAVRPSVPKVFQTFTEGNRKFWSKTVTLKTKTCAKRTYLITVILVHASVI